MTTIKDLGDLGEDILDHALTLLRSENNAPSMAVNLYMRSEPLVPSARLSVAGKERGLPLPTEAIHLFADLAPLANWAHPVRHLFYDRKAGELIHSEYDHFPPEGFGVDPNAFVPAHVPLVFTEPPRPRYRTSFRGAVLPSSEKSPERRPGVD